MAKATAAAIKKAKGLMGSIVEGTLGELGYLLVDAKQAAILVAEGLVVTNDKIVEEDKIATRAVESQLPTVDKATDGVGSLKQLTGKTGVAFAIGCGIPEAVSRTSAGRRDVYPFDQLEAPTIVEGEECCHFFFVPATEERPEPAKSLASTVSGATARFNVETDVDEPYVKQLWQRDESGKRVRDEFNKFIKVGTEDAVRKVVEQTRIFKIRAVEGGAKIYRTK